MRESSPLQRAAEEAVDWRGGDGLRLRQELEQEVLRDVADANHVCLPRLGGGNVDRKRRQVSSRRSKGG